MHLLKTLKSAPACLPVIKYALQTAIIFNMLGVSICLLFVAPVNSYQKCTDLTEFSYVQGNKLL